MKRDTTVHLSKGYITSLDGLRAIAVLIVLFFHAGFDNFKGGFIGVDIFFVLSGFLITSNIIRDIEHNKWSFSEFYLKRVARLFPALFTVLLATLVASYFILGADELTRLGKSGIYASMSVSNIFFWSESGYFDHSAQFKPLLHTWSLSVEEQFYLVWPSLIFLLFIKKSRRVVLVGLTLLTITLLAFTIYVENLDSSAVFFLTPFRVFQFYLGALVALIGVSLNGKIKELLSLFSVAIIIILVVVISKSSGMFLTMALPALAAAVFIFGSRTRLIEGIFSTPLLVWIGQRSYSIYLVHWPIFVLYKTSNHSNLSEFEMIILVLFSIITGALLTKFVENPFRFRGTFQTVQRARIIAGIVMMMLSIIVLSAHYYGEKGYPSRVSNEIKDLVKNHSKKWKTRQRELRTGVCNIILDNSTVNDFNVEVCLETPPNKKSYLVLGDSYASGAYLILKKAYPDINFGQLTIPGCHIRSDRDFNDQLNDKDSKCRTLYKKAIENFSNFDYKGVVIASRWQKGRLYQIDNLIRDFEKENLDIILFSHRQKFDREVKDVLLSSSSVKSAFEKINNMTSSINYDLNEKIIKRFSKKVKAVNILALQCPVMCDILDNDGNLIYLDDEHFSVKGANMISKRLVNKYPNLF